jgi:hypothetical protein
MDEHEQARAAWAFWLERIREAIAHEYARRTLDLWR